MLGPEVDDEMLVLQLRAQWAVPGVGRGESAWNFLHLASGLVDQQQVLWERWRDNCKVYWMQERSDDWIFERVVIQDKWPGIRPDLVIDLNEPGAEDSNGIGPIQSSPLITWQTGLIGRSYRGRTYWGPVRIDDMIHGGFVEVVRVQMDNFAFTMMEQFASDPMIAMDPHFIIFSRQHDGVPEPKGRYALVSGYRISPFLATQRRRQRFILP